MEACPSEEVFAQALDPGASQAERAELVRHLGGCDDCRRAAALLAPTLLSARGPVPAAGEEPVAPGATVGRYVIVRLLGEGAMGRVYVAYDPELDREVALKVLLQDPDLPPALAPSLLREARAMARLAHPNVIAVHDVGSHQGQVFLAMELVRGVTLRRWLATPRSWQEIGRVLEQAARGLAAAHASGIVHRDLKPENVLIGEDGRVRVGDFGLSQLGARQPVPAEGDLPITVTRTGESPGTPAYMAPEQLRGELADARSDQFSLGVVAFEALVGQRPFAGERLPELMASVQGGVPGPFRARVPGHVKRAVLRALAPSRGDRFPDIAQLGAALAPRPRRLGLALVAGGVAAALAAAFLLWPRSGPCDDVELAVHPRWNFTLRQEVSGRFARLQRADAPATLERLTDGLDAYAQQLIFARMDSCKASVRQEVQPATAEARSQCLERCGEALSALVELYRQPLDDALVERAVSLVGGLPRIADCNDVRALGEQTPLPADPALRARIASGEQALAQVALLRLAGRLGEARRQLDALGELPAHPPLAARRALESANLLTEEGGKAVSAEAAARQAIQLAAAARDDRLAARAWILLARIQGQTQLDQVKSDESLAAARAAVARLGDDPALLGELERVHAGVLGGRGDYPGALAHARQAVALMRQAYPPDAPPILIAQLDEAGAIADSGDLAAARKAYEAVLADGRRVLGADHPRLASTEADLGIVLSQSGELDLAEQHFAHALEIRRTVLGARHPDVAASLGLLGNVAVMRGERELARQRYLEALELKEASFGADSFELAGTLGNLANVEGLLGHYPAATAHAQRALELRERKLGPWHPQLVSVLMQLAASQRGQGQSEAAEASYARAVAVAEKAFGPADPRLGPPLLGVGAVCRDRHDLPCARLHLERARTLLHAGEDPMEADACNELALTEILALAYARALPFIACAREIWARGPDPGAVAWADLAEGQALNGLHRFAEALAVLERAERSFREHEDAGPEDLAALASALATARRKGRK